MSNSEPFVAENNEPEIKSGKQRNPTLENPEQSQLPAFHDQTTKPHQLITQKTKHDQAAVQEQTTKSKKHIDVRSKEDEDEDEGFRTPTSLHYKVPVIQNCPPAPRKPKTLISTTMNISTPRRDAPVFLSDEVVEWIISSSLLLDFHRKIKKPRTLAAD